MFTDQDKQKWRNWLLGVMSSIGVTISKDYIDQPIRNNTFCVHQISNRFQDGLEIILFRLSSQYNIESFVRILNSKEKSDIYITKRQATNWRRDEKWKSMIKPRKNYNLSKQCHDCVQFPWCGFNQPMKLPFPLQFPVKFVDHIWFPVKFDNGLFFHLKNSRLDEMTNKWMV